MDFYRVNMPMLISQDTISQAHVVNDAWKVAGLTLVLF